MRGSFVKAACLVLSTALLLPTVVAAVEVPDVERDAFGDYQLVPLLPESATYAGSPTPNSLDDIRVTRLVDSQLSDGAKQRLAEQGFVVVPSELRLFHEAYRDQYGTGTPVFVTTDAAYHTWHLVFDKVLRDVEQQELLPALEQLVTGMRRSAARQRDELAGSPLADDAARVHDLLAAAAAILGVGSGKLSERARAEVELIRAHSQYTSSPVLGTRTDYSLFTPRGHYTRSEDLTRYFLAMSVLGQHSFLLPDAAMPGDGPDPDPLAGMRRAMLASRTLVGDAELEALWRQVFEPSAFLVGAADDYTPFELAKAVEATVPGGWAEPLRATDERALRSAAQALQDARIVRIDSERPSIRLMGTRFVLDSWILDQLVSPNVGSPGASRVLGSALDLAAAFGSDYALAIQDAAGETAYLHYPEQMEAMRAAVAARPDVAWGSTVYDAWLAALEPMWLPYGEAFPDFMRSDGWRAKAQQTGFGSYAELKHDTILYTKQAFGDTGGGPPARPERNWVEPDPVPFGRLSAVAGLTRAGLAQRGLLPKADQEALDLYIDFVDRLARIATDELAGKPISEQDNDWLRFVGSTLERLWAVTGDQSRRGQQLDEDAAIIADIMRGLDMAAGRDEVLEVGTGYVDRIYVIVPDDAGRFSVASGGVYSYYEFPWPTSERLTDERWRTMLRDGQAPDRPAWQAPLFAAPVASGPLEPAATPVPSRGALERELGSAIAGASWEPYRRSPKGASFDPLKNGAKAAVIFDALERELDRSLDYVALFRFPAVWRLESYWAWRAEEASPMAPMRMLACADGKPGLDVWQHGEYLCYVSDDGVGLLRWTDERTGTYGVMNGTPGRGDLARLYTAWADIVGVDHRPADPSATIAP